MFLALVAGLCMRNRVYVCVESERDDVTFSQLLTEGPFLAGFIGDIVHRTEQLDPPSFSVTPQPGESPGSALNVNVFPLIWLFNRLLPNYHRMVQNRAGERSHKRRSSLAALASSLHPSAVTPAIALADDKFSPWTRCQYVDVPAFIKTPSNW